MDTYNYSSDNSSVASVDASGLVRLKGAGNAIITVTCVQQGSETPSVQLIPVVVVDDMPVIDVLYRVAVAKPNAGDIF